MSLTTPTSRTSSRCSIHISLNTDGFSINPVSSNGTATETPSILSKSSAESRYESAHPKLHRLSILHRFRPNKSPPQTQTESLPVPRGSNNKSSSPSRIPLHSCLSLASGVLSTVIDNSIKEFTTLHSTVLYHVHEYYTASHRSAIMENISRIAIEHGTSGLSML
ncbi:hypothetical protein CC78DRAFT_167965 [Lojkania enalia]|uniref:Uncharacterized protein n=1 Tax=Lojkania enalia TaxID=147567 RepID=A0A9P4KC32_9PLEO|nr:hypothetical protein CC78DRAFT_167965 [Didymosphaeria enalia]